MLPLTVEAKSTPVGHVSATLRGTAINPPRHYTRHQFSFRTIPQKRGLSLTYGAERHKKPPITHNAAYVKQAPHLSPVRGPF
jgi:hypothetical protein